MNVAPNWGFSRSSNLPVSLEFTSDRPRLPWQRKFGNFDEKMAKTRLIQKIEQQKVRQFTGVIEIYIRPTRVAMVTKIWECLDKNCYNSDNTRNRATMLHQTGGSRGQAICWCYWHLHQTDPGFDGNEKCEIFNTKLATMAHNVVPNTFSG